MRYPRRRMPFALPRFLVVPRSQVARHLLSPAKLAAISGVVSINGPGERPPPGVRRAARRLCLEFEDVADPSAPGAPGPEDIRRLVSFAPLLRETSTVLVHCEAGISRSTAAVLILAAALLGPGKEPEAVAAALDAVPAARPNRLMVTLADAELARGGALVAALTARSPPAP